MKMMVKFFIIVPWCMVGCLMKAPLALYVSIMINYTPTLVLYLKSLIVEYETYDTILAYKKNKNKN